MLNINVTDMNSLIAFWLVFCRWAGVALQFPLFDYITVPSILKVLFCMSVSYCFFPFLQGTVVNDIRYVGVDNFWLLTIFYSLVGLVIGYLSKIILSIFNSAGSIITQQIGFSAISYFDINSAGREGPFERLISVAMIVVVLTSGGLYPLFKGGYISFETMSYVGFSSMSGFVPFFLHLFKSIFSSAILLAMPLIFTNVFTMTVLGVVARMIPQMNVLMVSFILNIGLGLLVFLFCSDEFFRVGFDFYKQYLGDWLSFIK